MKKPLLYALTISAFVLGGHNAAWAAPETYSFDVKHTNIVWYASHFGFANSSGRFGVTEGKLVLDEAAPESSTVEVTIDTAGLETGIPDFTEHLKSPDFLDAVKYPTATFKSTAVKLTGEKTADVTGDLTLHGVTKPVTLKMTLNKIGVHPITNKKTAGFSGDIVLKRSEFGISAYIPGVSDEIIMTINAEAMLAE